MTAAVLATDLGAINLPIDDGSDMPATTWMEKFEQGFMVVVLLTGLISPIVGAIAAALH